MSLALESVERLERNSGNCFIVIFYSLSYSLSYLHISYMCVLLKISRALFDSRGTIVACAAALATSKLSRPVKIFNNRNADFAQTGGREAFSFDYQVGVTEEGKINALTYNIYMEAGMAKGDAMGSLTMGMMWADNAYYFPNYRATAKVCYTNTPARTSMVRISGFNLYTFSLTSIDLTITLF